MTKPKLAVDHDGTLANTYSTAFDLLEGKGEHDYTHEDIESWTWGFDEFGKDAYLSALWHVWNLRWDEVPPMEENLSQKMAALHSKYEVHVVTAHPNHPGISEGKKKWLDMVGVPYEGFHAVPMQTPKTEYVEYDAFIDDKPGLPGSASNGQTVYLRDMPWNQDAGGDYIRVDSLTDVLKKELAAEV